MPKMATEPLTKITTNLFQADVEWFKDRYGQGWSEILRDAVRCHVIMEKAKDEVYEQ